MIFIKGTRKGPCPLEHWNCFQDNIGYISEIRNAADMGLPGRVDAILPAKVEITISQFRNDLGFDLTVKQSTVTTVFATITFIVASFTDVLFSIGTAIEHPGSFPHPCKDVHLDDWA